MTALWHATKGHHPALFTRRWRTTRTREPHSCFWIHIYHSISIGEHLQTSYSWCGRAKSCSSSNDHITKLTLKASRSLQLPSLNPQPNSKNEPCLFRSVAVVHFDQLHWIVHCVLIHPLRLNWGLKLGLVWSDSCSASVKFYCFICALVHLHFKYTLLLL